jgi:hypothetical protein
LKCDANAQIPPLQIDAIFYRVRYFRNQYLYAMAEVFEKFAAEFRDWERLKSAYASLCFDRRNPLIAQEITSCNAAAGYGIGFSRASCETRQYTQEIYPFGSVFTSSQYLSMFRKTRRPDCFLESWSSF